MLNTRSLVLLVGLGSGVAACDNDPGAGKTKAKVSEAVAEQSRSDSDGATVYRFSDEDSKLEFVGAKVTGKHEGNFNTFEGTLRVIDGDPTKSSVSVVVHTESIESDNPRLTKHLKSDDFLDVAQHKKATFESTSITRSAGKYQVTGNMALNGVKKSIAFPAEIKVSDQQIDVKADFVINRKDFEIVYEGKPDDLIKDEVNLQLTLKAKRTSGS
jgi:polyisoprenoid-binding protein YceI